MVAVALDGVMNEPVPDEDYAGIKLKDISLFIQHHQVLFRAVGGQKHQTGRVGEAVIIRDEVEQNIQQTDLCGHTQKLV